MSYYNSGVPEQRQDCPMPPYNATNFNSENGPVFNTLQSYAQTQQQYPLPAGSNANQIYRNSANVMLFNSINQKTLDIRAKNDALHAHAKAGFKNAAPGPRICSVQCAKLGHELATWRKLRI